MRGRDLLHWHKNAVLPSIRSSSQLLVFRYPRPCTALRSDRRLQYSSTIGISFRGRHRLDSNQCLAVRCFKDRSLPDNSNSKDEKRVIIAIAITVVMAVANRVLYKLALVPMKHYPFFLAQLNTFGQITGIVTDEMLAIPKWRFVVIGFLEALGIAAGMASAAVLPGPLIPVLSQTFLVWQLGLSIALLGKKYSIHQLTGCLLVATGVVVAVASGSKSNLMLHGIDFIWPSVMVMSSASQAGASIIKEYIFIDAAKRLKDKTLDIFVVNSFGSGFQALFVLLLLPFLSSLKGIHLRQLPSYLRSGAGCLVNIGANTQGCDGAPMLPLLYIIANMGFNITSLYLIKISSAITSSLSVMLSVPLSIYVLSLPLPYLPAATVLSPLFIGGSLVLVLGLFIYSCTSPAHEKLT